MNPEIPPSKIAAFFDFDETLLAIDSAKIGFKVLREQGYLSNYFMIKMMIVLFFKKRGFIDDQRMAKVLLSFYRGRELKIFTDSAAEFYQEYLQPNLAPAVVEKLKWHHSQGHITVLLTGSIDYYLHPVMEDLGIDHLLCTHLEVDSDGLLTGRSEGLVCVGDVKVTFAQDLAKDLGVDMAQSFAYGNSELDIPILSQVGHPVIVNPSSALARHAQKNGWPSL